VQSVQLVNILCSAVFAFERDPSLTKDWIHPELPHLSFHIYAASSTPYSKGPSTRLSRKVLKFTRAFASIYTVEVIKHKKNLMIYIYIK